MAQLKDLIVNGPSRFIGDVYATTFTGDLNGNANTATSATTAAALTGKTLVTASAVTTSNWPTYADNYIPTMSFVAHWNGAYSGTSSNLTYCAQGTIIGSNNIGNQSVKYATTSGSCSGNAATATKATQDGNGNVIANTYLPLSGGTMTNPIKFSYNNNGDCNVSRNSGFSMFFGNQSGAENQGFPIQYSSVISFMTGYCGMQFANYGGTNDNRLFFRNISDRDVWTPWYTLLHSDNYTSYTVKKDGTGASGTWGINISGNATTAITATTATKIGTSTVGSTTMPVYINSGTPTAITSFPEAYLSWGGTNTSGSVTPIGMTLSSEHSANRLAFINGNALKFEYSSDAGSTWTDYGYTASIKSQVFTTSYGVPIGRANSSTEYTTNSRTRITLTAQDGTNGYVYTNPRKMLINISSSGGMQVLIEYRTGTNYKNNGAWTTFGTYTLSGWSGWNDIPLILSTLGGGNTQTSNNWQLRFTFIMTSKHSDYPTTASVYCIRIFGEKALVSPSTMAATGHLYSYDASQNATFPAKVTATGGFSGNLTGNADTSNRAKFLETFQQNSTTTTYGSQYPIWAQWSDSTNVRLKCTNYTVWTDKATYATTAGSAPASDVKAWAKADTKPSYTGSEVKLTGYSHRDSYETINETDTVNQAIGKLEGAISGLETLLASI